MQKTALHQQHISLGAKMVNFAGFEMPVQYQQGIIFEHHTVRNSVGIFDVSHMGEFLIEGKESIELIQKISANDVNNLVDGKAQYSYMPNQNGGIVDDILIYRINVEKYLLVVNAGNIKKDWDWVNSQNNFNCKLTNISNQLSLFAIQGPKAIDVLQKLTPINLSKIKYYTFIIGNIANIDNVIISATGYTGLGGFELYIKNEDAVHIWKEILKNGKTENIEPIGLAARDTLRLEKGFCLYGNDIDDTTSPIEAGLGWVTKFTKEFINSEQLLIQKNEGVRKKLIAFKMIDRGIPRKEYIIKNNQNENIGQVTSGTNSPSLKIGIGMGYVKKEVAEVGNIIFIEIRNRVLKAEIIKLPFI